MDEGWSAGEREGANGRADNYPTATGMAPVLKGQDVESVKIIVGCGHVAHASVVSRLPTWIRGMAPDEPVMRGDGLAHVRT